MIVTVGIPLGLLLILVAAGLFFNKKNSRLATMILVIGLTVTFFGVNEIVSTVNWVLNNK